MKRIPVPAQWQAIPLELQQRRQWLLAGPDGKGDLKVPTSLAADWTPTAGSSTNSSTWLDFETACKAAAHYGLAIGFVVSKTDPYCCVDLDIKNQHNEPDPGKWSSDADIDLCRRMVESFQSYTERSQSGQGLHIWVRANIGEGVKRKPVEVYSQARFLVCTGDVVFNAPIEERQAIIDLLVSEARRAQADAKAELDEGLPEVYDDLEIVERLGSHVNADKYFALYKGEWESLGYPSQSEADLSLMSFYTFYSKNNEQCRRLFRMSKLGQRDKATKNDVYLNRTLQIIRGRQEREHALEAHGEQVAREFMQQAQTQAPPQAESYAEPPPTPTPEGAQAPAVPVASDSALDWPPGFTGYIARYIYDSSPRPVREVAIVSALGLMAGLMGRGWNIQQSGLNCYIVLIARSAIGKEAMHSGISRIMQQLSTSMGHGNILGAKILDFVDFAEYASGPALLKAIAANPCFVNVSGEWGRRLKGLSHEGDKAGPLSSLRTQMTNLYQKSGSNSIVGGMAYSDKEKNVASVAGVAYSMIGETTPGTFYESLTDAMMEDGFLSRFTVIEYDGDRPPLNHTPAAALGPECVNHLLHILNRACNNKSGGPAMLVQAVPEAAQALYDFDKHCDTQINGTKDESWRQMWNRAHLKVYRLAALLAAADSPDNPWIQLYHVSWALDVILRDIGLMTRRMKEGDVGQGDVSRERKLMSFLADYIKKPPYGSYNLNPALIKDGIVPRSYLQIRVQRTPSFTSHALGVNKALDETLRSLMDSGYLLEVQKDKLATDYGYRGRAFRVVNLPAGYL